MVQVPPTGLQPWDQEADAAFFFLDNKIDAEADRAAAAEFQLGLQAHAAGAAREAVFHREGNAAVGVGVSPYPATSTLKIVNVVVVCTTAPLGSDLVFDVKKNGASIFTTVPKPTIAAGTKFGETGAPDIDDLVKGDVLTADITDIGDSVSGAETTVVVVFG